jgi:beta-glucosidase
MQDRTYRYFHADPLYGFGFGLSYSSFAFSNLHLSSTRVKAGENLTVDAEVKNTSDLAGDEVAELYLEYGQKAGAPLPALKGFQRVHLAAGQTRRVSFTLNPRELSMATETGERMVLAGSYTVFVGGSQPGQGARGVRADFQIIGQRKLPQ